MKENISKPNSTDEAYFEVDNLSMHFGGLKALNQVDFSVGQGEFLAIAGPNGAGKSTILNCMSRFYAATEGNLLFKGKNIGRLRPHEIPQLGIGRTFQNIELFNKVSVLDNLLLGRHPKRKTSLFSEALFLSSVRRQEISTREKAEEVIDFLDLRHYRNAIVENLPYGIQKTVELGRALMMDPELLLLDEPTSGLNIEETEDLGFWIQDLRMEAGITFIVVEHNMKFVVDLADRVIVLNFGEIISDGRPEEVMNDETVIEAYLGDSNDDIEN